MNALEKLKLIRQNYAKDLPNKLKEIEDLFENAKSEGFSEEKLQTLYRLAHNLVGSGETFGFTDVSSAARELCNALEKYTENDASYPNKEEIEKIDKIVLHLLQHTLVNKDQEIGIKQNLELKDEDEENDFASQNKTTLYILERDKAVVSDLTAYLENFGYILSVFKDIKSFKKAIDAKLPDIVLMDIVFGDMQEENFKSFMEIKKEHKKKCKLIFLSEKGDFLTRIHGVRLNSDAFFTKPVDMRSLTKELDKFAKKSLQKPIRALLLDDESSLNQYHASLLNNINIQTECISRPEEILNAMSSFQPDIIITDLYMPKFSGQEVLQVIRQMDEYLSIPVLFLSVEKRDDVKYELMNMGSEYFLQKPVDIEVFASIVKSRALRYKSMREMIQLDGLTNLYNHGTIMTLLEKEIANAKRYNYPLSFAMLDLDSFKAVNDTYGHQTGDTVLQSLSRLLQARVRSTDIIGRYGGEEFCIIFPHTNIESASIVLENIRKTFAQIIHTFNDERFNVTLSLGVSEYNNNMTITELVNKADEALYKAKANGKNTVVKA